MLAGRLALVALAVIACAWFALGARAAHDQKQVAALVQGTGRLTSTQAAVALRRLDRAATLNPDRGVDLLRAEVVQRAGRIDEEVRILRALVRTEPKNIFGWLLLYYAAYRQPALSQSALAQVRALAPHVPPAP